MAFIVSGTAAMAQQTAEERVMANVAWLAGAYLFSVHTGLRSVSATEAELFDQTLGRTKWRLQARKLSDCEYVAISVPQEGSPISVAIDFSKLSDHAYMFGNAFVVEGKGGSICERRPIKATAQCFKNMSMFANGVADRMFETVRFIKANACQGYASGRFGPRF